jgi:hypothetical protein
MKQDREGPFDQQRGEGLIRVTGNITMGIALGALAERGVLVSEMAEPRYGRGSEKDRIVEAVLAGDREFFLNGQWTDVGARLHSLIVGEYAKGSLVRHGLG